MPQLTNATLLANRINLNIRAFVWGPHVFIFHHLLSSVFICHIYLDWLSKIYQLPYVFPSAVYLLFKVSTFVMREIFLLSLSAVNHFWLGQEQEALGLSWAHTHIYTHGWQPDQEWVTIAVISDISPDSGYPNLCTRLGTAHHPEPFRHSSLDRWIGKKEAERERGDSQFRYITKKRWMERRQRARNCNGEVWEGAREAESNHLDVPWRRERESQHKWKETDWCGRWRGRLRASRGDRRDDALYVLSCSMSGNWPLTRCSLTSHETVSLIIHLNKSFSLVLSLKLLGPYLASCAKHSTSVIASFQNDAVVIFTPSADIVWQTANAPWEC